MSFAIGKPLESRKLTLNYFENVSMERQTNSWLTRRSAWQKRPGLINVCACVRIHIHACLHCFVCMCVFVCIQIHINIYACMYVPVCMSIYFVCMHTGTNEIMENSRLLIRFYSFIQPSNTFERSSIIRYLYSSIIYLFFCRWLNCCFLAITTIV